MLEILAATVDLSAVVSGIRTGQKLKSRRQALTAGEPMPKKPEVWPLVTLILAAVFFTGLVFFKWYRAVR